MLVTTEAAHVLLHALHHASLHVKWVIPSTPHPARQSVSRKAVPRKTCAGCCKKTDESRSYSNFVTVHESYHDACRAYPLMSYS